MASIKEFIMPTKEKCILFAITGILMALCISFAFIVNYYVRGGYPAIVTPLSLCFLFLIFAYIGHHYSNKQGMGALYGTMAACLHMALFGLAVFLIASLWLISINVTAILMLAIGASIIIVAYCVALFFAAFAGLIGALLGRFFLKKK
ncbi:MAG: hypothetical protein WC263_02530 [Candidatus Micrarchaeia archaeon]|jgi:hypothetical protein